MARSKFIGSIIAPLLRDALGLGGCCAITYGAWLVYEPAGFIVGGAFSLFAAVSLASTDIRQAERI